MAMGEVEKTLEETSTWAVAVVCFVLLVISIGIEKAIHIIGTWFKKKHKHALYEALEKLKAELMLLGFISLLLTILQTPISKICIPKSIASTMRPCTTEQYTAKKKKEAMKNSSKIDHGEKSCGRLVLELAESYIPRRSLATKGYDTCKGQKEAFVSAYGIHQLHIFIFVLAVVHVIYCIVTYALGKTKMRRWKQWEKETETLEYQYSNDPGRLRFARDTTFGRRHLNFWSKSSVMLWTVCFFRQFFGSVTKVDYLALRHGFITAHFSSIAPGSESRRYDFRKYIKRSLEQDYKTVVEIKPIIWFVAVLFLLTNSTGLHSYLWSPFIPLVVLIIVGTKLQVIITKLGLRIQEKGDVVIGAVVVEPCDDLFWFDNPELILFLIHLVLFTNAFQLAFFVWSTYEFKLNNCFHESNANVAIRLVVGLVVQIQCSYMTLPLYALVTQMGSKIKPTVFNERVGKVLKKWHDTAKKQTIHGRHSESNTPYASRPNTPTHGSSPIHLLHNVKDRSDENFPNNPESDNHDHHQFWDPESQHPETGSSTHHSTAHESLEKKPVFASVELPPIQTSKSLSYS